VQTLQDLHPEHSWEYWKFKSVPASYWKSEENQREYLEYVANKYKVKDLEGWYTMTLDKLQTEGS
jgi:hypothetical protein